jgi:hypothetical protein
VYRSRDPRSFQIAAGICLSMTLHKERDYVIAVQEGQLDHELCHG